MYKRQVDVISKTKREAFNHQKLAAILSAELNTEINHSELPIYRVALSEDLKVLTFTTNRQKYTCHLNDYSLSKTSTRKINPNENIATNGKLAAYIENYNLWIRNLETNKRTQITFDGKKDYGYATNNAGWIKSDGAVLKLSPNSDKISTFQQDAR